MLAELAEGRVTANTFSINYARKLYLFYNLSNFVNTESNYCVLKIYSFFLLI